MGIYKKKEKFIVATPFLEGTDGRKMSKSWGNVINIADAPEQQYGKIMSMKDELLGSYFNLATRLPVHEIKEIEKEIRIKKTNPRDLKARLAREVVSLYYGERAASEAGKEFNKIFKQKELPSEMPVVKISEGPLYILDLLTKSRLVVSKSEAKRLILQGGVKINKETEKDWQKIIKIKKGTIIQVGKRKFARIG